MTDTIASVSDLHKTFRRGSEEVHALRGVTLTLSPGEIVAVMGPSGSGKSTLLNILSGWEHPDSGTVSWHGRTDVDMRALQWHKLGIVPQRLGLLEDLPALENVELPLVLSGVNAPEASERARAVMVSLDIDQLADRLPGEASLGEQQRMCVARAIVSRPVLILADEPTGNQDAKREASVFQQLRERAHAGAACLIATHNDHALPYCDRLVRMHDGEIVSDESLRESPWQPVGNKIR